MNDTWFFSITAIRSCLHLLSNRPVTGMTGCAACRTMRMGGIALKMGVLFERSEFRPFSNDGHSQRNGSFGRPPFAMPKRFARNQRFRLSAYLDSFFFGGTKKNEYMRQSLVLFLLTFCQATGYNKYRKKTLQRYTVLVSL